MALSEQVCHWEEALRFQKTCTVPSVRSPPLACESRGELLAFPTAMYLLHLRL